jgi:hypothetical protein
MTKLALIGALALSGLAVLVAPMAYADPPCAAFGTCRYMPNPYYDGPLMPTWDTPGTYGGWTNLPVMCDPSTYECQQYAPGL